MPLFMHFHNPQKSASVSSIEASSQSAPEEVSQKAPPSKNPVSTPSWNGEAIATMAITIKQMSLIVSLPAQLSFILGMIAYFMKPDFGMPVISKDSTAVTCEFSYDPIILSSVALLVYTTVAGCISIFFPYKQQSVPPRVLFKRMHFLLSFIVSLISTGGAATLMLWPTITEQRHLSHKVHPDLHYTCPTAGPGDLIVLGALLAGFSGIFWLTTVLAREDVIDEDKDVNGASYLAI